MKGPVVLSTGTSTIVVVKDLPKSASDFEIIGDANDSFLQFDVNVGDERFYDGRPLPAGRYSILGWSDEISEEQAQKLFRRRPILGHDYFAYKELANVYYTALECLASFLTANNIERELLLIKK